MFYVSQATKQNKKKTSILFTLATAHNEKDEKISNYKPSSKSHD